jgi:hypothetical protein
MKGNFCRINWPHPAEFIARGLLRLTATDDTHSWIVVVKDWSENACDDEAGV